MRTLAAFAALLSTAAHAQVTSGTYRVGQEAVPWSVDSGGALRWNGEPYAPVGAAIAGTPEAIAAAKAAGVEDVVVDVPGDGRGWPALVQALEGAGMRYLFRLDGAAPAIRGYVVDPAAYRVGGVTEERRLDLSVPGADNLVVVTASRRDGSVTQFERVTGQDGQFVYRTKGTTDTEMVVLAFPEGTTYEGVDAWGEMDGYRDRLLAAIREAGFGRGFRGIVNPVGSGLRLPSEVKVIPTGEFYRFEMARHLEAKYRSLDAATRAWAVTSGFNVDAPTNPGGAEFVPLKSFADLARLVPLWRGRRGVAQFFDPTTGLLLPADRGRSVVWADVATVTNGAVLRRYRRLNEAIRLAADVPILQEWRGWSPVTESPDAGLTGIGMAVRGKAFSEIAEDGSRATSSVLRWPGKGWIAATDVRLGTNTPAEVGPALDDLQSLGARAVYLRAANETEFKMVAAERARRPTLDTGPVQAIFFPENASEPAQAQRLPGGLWWLPSPAGGNRLDLGDRIFGYRLTGPNGDDLYLWTDRPGPVRLLLPKANGVTVRSLDGNDPRPRASKGGLELILGEVPVVLGNLQDLPVPEPSVKETNEAFKQLLALNQERKRDVTTEVLAYKNATAGMARSPAGSFALLREAYRSAAMRVGDAVWIEAEGARRHTMSDVVDVGGCSNGQTLGLDARFPSDEGFFAEYGVEVRTGADQEVWLAARVPAERRRDVTVQVGSQTLALPDAPTTYYGQGFGWYRLGVTRLTGNLATLKIQVARPFGGEFAFDAILVTPGSFVPRGLRLPPPPPPSGAAPTAGSAGRG